MTAGAVLTRQARWELVRALQWTAKDNTDAATQFNDALLDATQRLGVQSPSWPGRADGFLPSNRFGR